MKEERKQKINFLQNCENKDDKQLAMAREGERERERERGREREAEQ